MEVRESDLSRRGFLKLGGIVTGSLAVAGLAGCSGGASEEKPAYLPEAWDQETEILVVGCGGAGISAGITAATEGLGECLVLEAAPAGFEGGNTRLSAQVMFVPRSVEGAMKYQRNLNGPYEVDEDLLRAWAENICENVDWLMDLGLDPRETPAFNPEWADVEGSEECNCYLLDGTIGAQSCWNGLALAAEENGVAIQNDTRVVDLVFDPATKEVFGVKAEVAGEEKFIKASKAVILACGGFENDPEMIKEYFTPGMYDIKPHGTIYNRGDGVRMAKRIGAELWHMNNFANNTFSIQVSPDVNPTVNPVAFAGKDFIYVGANAKRYFYEEEISLQRHGKLMYGGVSSNTVTPSPTYAIFGSKSYDAAFVAQNVNNGFCTWHGIYGTGTNLSNDDLLNAGIIVKGDTPEELAEKLGLDSDMLAATISGYNANALKGADPEYHRGEAIYSAFAGFDAQQGEDVDNDAVKPAVAAFQLETLDPPYYGMKLSVGMMNTQGGAKRAANGQIVDVDGNPIPRLFGAGEFGCIYSYNYNGGGNVSEAISSGRLAAREAGKLEAWDVESK